MVFICVEFSPFPAGWNANGTRSVTHDGNVGLIRRGACDESVLRENIAPIMMDTWDTHNESKGFTQKRVYRIKVDGEHFVQHYTDTRPPTWIRQHTLLKKNETIILAIYNREQSGIFFLSF